MHNAVRNADEESITTICPSSAPFRERTNSASTKLLVVPAGDSADMQTSAEKFLASGCSWMRLAISGQRDPMVIACRDGAVP